MGIFEIFDSALVKPMREGTGYNIFTTALIIACLFLGIFLFSRSRHFVKRKGDAIALVLDALPFVIFGSALRSLEDGCYIPCSWPVRLFFITPWLWLEVFFIFLAGSRFLGEKKVRALGWVLAVPCLAFAVSHFRNYQGVFTIFGFAIVSVALFLGPLKKALLALKIPSIESNLAKAVFIVHALDASSTLVAVQFYGYFEEHVFARFLMSIGGAPLFFAAKLAGIYCLALFAEKWDFPKNERALLFLAMFLVGFGPALRNSFSLGMGV